MLCSRLRGTGLHLELVSKLLLKPHCHRRFRPVTRQVQIILKVYGLGEKRQPLVQVFGEPWWPFIRRYKLESCSVDGLTTLLDVQRVGKDDLHYYRCSDDPEGHLRPEFQVTSFKNIHKQLPGPLKVSRLAFDHRGRIFHAPAEVHSQGLSRIDEPRVDNCPRSVPA